MIARTERAYLCFNTAVFICMSEGLTDGTSKVGHSAGINLIGGFSLESERSWIAVKGMPIVKI